MSHKITYGLRDRTTGYLVCLDREEEAVWTHTSAATMIEGGDPDSHSDPRYEVSDLADLIATIRENPPRYNSSRKRPHWGAIDVGNCIPTAIIREAKLDVGGGTPALVSETLRKAVMPGHHVGKVYTSRDTAPLGIMRRTFGDDLKDLAEDDRPKMYIVDVRNGPIEKGMTFEGGFAVLNQAVSVVEVPEDWPAIRVGDGLVGPDYRLVLARTNNIAQDVAIVDFEASDFTPDLAPTM